jgi:nucleolar protein 4
LWFLQQKAQQLTQKSEESRKKFDRRHLYLAKEGTIAGGTEAANNMPSADLGKREEAARDKNNKLRNPLFFVSPFRLSIRNLNKGIGDKDLKKTILKASEEGKSFFPMALSYCYHTSMTPRSEARNRTSYGR